MVRAIIDLQCFTSAVSSRYSLVADPANSDTVYIVAQAVIMQAQYRHWYLECIQRIVFIFRALRSVQQGDKNMYGAE
jgi:hypothetical protein